MTTNKVLLSAVIIAAVTAGCRTDVLKKNRIAGEWTVDMYSQNGSNLIASQGGSSVTMTMEFDKDGDFDMSITNSYNYGGYSYTYSFDFTGTWEDNDKDLQLDFDANSEGAEYFYGTSLSNYLANNYGGLRETYDIIELTKDKLEMETTINGVVFKIEADKED